MSSYPITSSETIDMARIMGMNSETVGTIEDNTNQNEATAVYADYSDLEASEMILSSFVKNNLTEFKNILMILTVKSINISVRMA